MIFSQKYFGGVIILIFGGGNFLVFLLWQASQGPSGLYFSADSA